MGGGEEVVSLSVEETNALRARLGLKPLKVDDDANGNANKRRRVDAPEPDTTNGAGGGDDAGEAARRRLAAMREERLKSGRNGGSGSEPALETLGARRGAADDDDVLAWVDRSRVLEAKQRREDHKRALALGAALAAQDEFDDGEDRPQYTAADLHGHVRVDARTAEAHAEPGTSAVLTLRDRGVLDDDDEGDVLEDAKLGAAPVASNADGDDAGPEGGTQGEDAMAVDVDARGAVDAAALARREAVRKRLRAEGGVSLASAPEDPMRAALADFWTPEEMAAMAPANGEKKKRRRKKKSSRMRREDIDAIAADADPAPAAHAQETHHRSRGAPALGGSHPQGGADATKEAAYLQEQRERDAAYTAAAARAAHASAHALGPSGGAAAGPPDEEEEEEEAFFASLAKAREAARGHRQSQATRERELALLASAGGGPSDPPALPSLYRGEVITTQGEFCKTISKAVPSRQEEREQAKKLAEPAGTETAQPKQPELSQGPAANAEGAAGPSAPPAPASAPGPPSSEAAPLNAAEGGMGKGLGGALQLLQGRGELRTTVRWGGRTNDRQHTKVRDVLASSEGAAESRFAQDVEHALTRLDEFGRVMTPKEAFRELCHKFHGIAPGKKQKQKRIKKYLEEQEELKTSKQ